MIVGKMFPVFVYRDEASVWTRLALSLGMCPRGEVGAGVIVVSLTFGIGGDAIKIAVICLALNLVASSLFIMSVKKLAAGSIPEPPTAGAVAPAAAPAGAPAIAPAAAPAAANAPAATTTPAVLAEPEPPGQAMSGFSPPVRV